MPRTDALCAKQASFGQDYASRANYLRKNGHNSYFVWLQKGWKRLYHCEEDLSPENRERVSSRIAQARQDIRRGTFTWGCDTWTAEESLGK